jgi:hypothetical protein
MANKIMTIDTLPFPIIRAEERRPVAGWLLSSAAWVGLYGSAALWLAVTALIIETKGFIGFVFALGMFGLFYVTVFPRMVRLILRGRKMRSPRANDILSGQSRAPVVLLRSFEDDDLIDPSFPTTSQIAPGRYEERLAKALSAVGPSVALGRPGEPEPELGAARLYVEDKHWQQAISFLLKQATAVVAVVGRSSGLWWEIELALAEVTPEKLLFFFPYPAKKEVRTSYLRTIFLQHPFFGKWLRRKMAPLMESEREERYQVFRERFGPHFKHLLPDRLGSARFLHMDHRGVTHLIQPVQPPLLGRIVTLNFRPSLDVPFKRELKPFVQKVKAGRH